MCTDCTHKRPTNIHFMYDFLCTQFQTELLQIRKKYYQNIVAACEFAGFESKTRPYEMHGKKIIQLNIAIQISFTYAKREKSITLIDVSGRFEVCVIFVWFLLIKQWKCTSISMQLPACPERNVDSFYAFFSFPTKTSIFLRLQKLKTTISQHIKKNCYPFLVRYFPVKIIRLFSIFFDKMW